MEELDLENCKAVTDVGIMAIADGCTNSKNLKFNIVILATLNGVPLPRSENYREPK